MPFTLHGNDPPQAPVLLVDAMVFPHCHWDLDQSGLAAGWPQVLNRASRAGEPVLFVPFAGGRHFGYGTECEVTLGMGTVRFTGQHRVRLLDRRSRPDELPVYRFQRLQDVVPPGTPAEVARLLPLLSDWLRLHPERAWAAPVIGVADPGVVSDVVCVVLFGSEPHRAPLLAVDDVAQRLHLCADHLTALLPPWTPPPPPLPRPEPPATPVVPASTTAPAGLLARYSRDMVADARAGKLKPITGRDAQIEELETVLAKLGKTSAILVGEPGVGKTAIVEGLAARIAAGDCAPRLARRPLRALDLPGVVAGTTLRGQFEERIQGIVAEAISDGVILFIDEIHGLVGAGDSTGGMDAANIVKPAVAAGDLTVIGATTWDEYHRSIEKDGALKRRFSVVEVPTPNIDATIGILRNLRQRFVDGHGLAGITDDAIEAIVRLSDRYLADRSFPDKAIDLLDEVCASETRKRAAGGPRTVDRPTVTSYLARKLGVPLQALDTEAPGRVLRAADELGRRVIGQEPAVRAVADALIRTYGGIRDPERPIACLLFDGPPGVGKTELARALADFLFPAQPDGLIRLDMTEFKDRHMVSALTGAPPGYIGSEKEGRLTGLVKRHPHCVLLLDEIDKASPDVRDILLQIFEGARLRDTATGEVVRFSEVLVVLTSNVGYRDPDPGAALEGHFGGPLLSRMEVISFGALTVGQQRQVVALALRRVAERAFQARRIALEVDPSAVDLVHAATYDAAASGRELVGTVRKLVEDPLNRAVVEGRVGEGARVVARAVANELVFETAGADPA